MSVQPMTIEIIELLHNHITAVTELQQLVQQRDAEIAMLREQMARPCVHEANDEPTPFPNKPLHTEGIG